MTLVESFLDFFIVSVFLDFDVLDILRCVEIGMKQLCSLLQPPENELQKNSDRVLSEHELRVQRSLQKLNVPEW